MTGRAKLSRRRGEGGRRAQMAAKAPPEAFSFDVAKDIEVELTAATSNSQVSRPILYLSTP